MNKHARRWPAWALSAVLALAAAPSAAATPIPPGKWSFVFTDAKGRADRPLRVYTYRPRDCDTRCPIQFVLHGVKRNASEYRDYWEYLADRYHLIVIAPEFSQKNWAKAAGYNLGDVKEQPDREKWAFAAIEHLFDEVRDGQADYRIFGHSAGGQFVHRMVIFRPDIRASVAVAANPGWYTMPEWRKDATKEEFPYTLVGSPAGEKELRRAFERRFVLMVGEKDTDPDDENLNQSEGAKKQGATRVERAENFFKAATTAAGTLGAKFAWQYLEAPETAHDGAAMSKFAADTLANRK